MNTCISSETLLCHRADADGADDVAASLALLMPVINLAFFGLVGAGVRLVRRGIAPVATARACEALTARWQPC